MAYTVDPFDDTRPVGADDAGELTNELRQIKTQLKRFRDGVEKDFSELYETMSEADGGLPLELGGTGVQSLNGLKELLGISEIATPGISNVVVYRAGTHLWQVPDELRGTGRKFLVILGGAGGGGYNDTGNRSGGCGGNGGLSATLMTTSETSIQIVVATGRAGRSGQTKSRAGVSSAATSTFGTILEAKGGGSGGADGNEGNHGTASGGLIQLVGGGAVGGEGTWRGQISTNNVRGKDGYCAIVW